MKLFRYGQDKFALVIPKEDKERLKLKENVNYALEPVSEEEWKLIIAKDNRVSQELYTKLPKLSFHDRIEGEFEKKLSEQEKEAFKQLLGTGKVKKFKGGEKYKHYVYVTDKEFERLSKRNKAKYVQNKAAPVQNTYIRLGYQKITSDDIAYEYSQKYASDFRSGKAIGVKGFDGNYYLLRRDVFENNYAKIIGAIRDGYNTISGIAEYIKTNPEKVECILAIMQDKGIIYEAKKGHYKVVE